MIENLDISLESAISLSKRGTQREFGRPAEAFIGYSGDISAIFLVYRLK